MNGRFFIVTLMMAFLTLSFAVTAYAEGLPKTAPEKVGLSGERLQRITDVMQPFT